MQRHKITGITDTITIDDAETIRALAADEQIDRKFKRRPLWNGLFLNRLLRNLSFKGRRFPHMLPREDGARMARHEELWADFNAKAPAMQEGPETLEPLARWIRQEIDSEPGILVQQIIGTFFKPDFKATPESWQAALTLREDAISTNLPKMLWWQVTGKARRAKALLGAVTDDHIVAMHGIAVAAHNLVATMSRLRTFYADETLRNSLRPDMAVEQGLSAPPVVYRQALAKGAAAGCPYSKSTLFLLKLKEASLGRDAKDMIFMSGTWSRCPAEAWVPAVIAGSWKRACLRLQ